jgi:hypothetical protein
MWRGGPVIWTIMGVIGALACMLFSGGGACIESRESPTWSILLRTTSNV